MQNIYGKIAYAATASWDIITYVNSSIPWMGIANVIATIALLYLHPGRAIAGILIGYVFSKAKGQEDRELDKIMKAITEFIFKHPFIAPILGFGIVPHYTIPCIHFYWSLNVGRYMRGEDLHQPKEWWNLRKDLTNYVISFLPSM